MTFRGVLVQHAPWPRDNVARFYIADAVTLTACSVMQSSVAAHEVGNKKPRLAAPFGTDHARILSNASPGDKIVILDWLPTNRQEYEEFPEGWGLA